MGDNTSARGPGQAVRYGSKSATDICTGDSTYLTETDARTLEPGSTVTVTLRGHVTPLAADTLRERRVTVVREDSRLSMKLSLVPAADIRTVAIAQRSHRHRAAERPRGRPCAAAAWQSHDQGTTHP